MKKTLGIVMLAAIIAVNLIAVDIYAETKSMEWQQKSEEMSSSQVTQGQTTRAYERAYQTSDFIGTSLKNRQGENVGKINDVVFDSSGRLAFVIVSSGGLAGFGDKKVAVPFNSLQYDTGNRELVLNISKEKLASAREWDSTILRDRAAAAEVYRHFGQQPYWEGTMHKEMKKEMKLEQKKEMMHPETMEP